MPLEPVFCPECQMEAHSVQTAWGIRHECCGLWSWGGKPLVDRRTHEARKAAHEAFDRIWKEGLMSRSAAYAAMRKALRLTEARAHMSFMDAGTARRAAAWSSTTYASLSGVRHAA